MSSLVEADGNASVEPPAANDLDWATGGDISPPRWPSPPPQDPLPAHLVPATPGSRPLVRTHVRGAKRYVATWLDAGW